MLHIVKRKGHNQEFDDRKIYAAVFASCMAVRIPKEEAEKISDKVCKKLNMWIKDKKEVSSDEIFKKVSQELMEINKEAAFLYTTHRDLS